MVSPLRVPQNVTENVAPVPAEVTVVDTVSGLQVSSRRGYSVPPVSDPQADSLGQYQVETFARPQVGDRILTAEFGDPDSGMRDAPPYVRAHPRGVSVMAMPLVAELALDHRFGTVAAGKFAFRNACQDISIGGITNMNPLLMNCVPSTTVTPISTLVFALRTSVTFRAASRFRPPALDAAPSRDPLPEPGPERGYELVTNTGRRISTRATSAEHAKVIVLATVRGAGDTSIVSIKEA